ncbi:MAG: sigma-70 family RNA polymerase sigma factor [Elainella sp.]
MNNSILNSLDSTDPLRLVAVSGDEYFGETNTDIQSMDISEAARTVEGNELSSMIGFGSEEDLEDLMASRASGYRKTISDDAVGAFFKEMARYPLLKPNEEVELARRVKFLGEVEELKEALQVELERPVTKADLAAKLNLTERQLEHRLYLSRVAKRKMIRSNLRLVVSIAKRYLNRGVPFLDLIQEGALGLNRATEKFDPDRGCKFCTYAYGWIDQAISRTIAKNARTIRLPLYMVEKLNKLKKAHRELLKDLNRNPTEAELAESLEMKPDQLRDLQQLQQRSLSLNLRVGPGEDTELGSLIADHSAQSPEVYAQSLELRYQVQCLLLRLPEQQRSILELRYGFGGGEPLSLSAIAVIVGISRERVRQIEAKTLRQLKSSRFAENRAALKEYLNE